ncbi:hypothetical protein [Bacillus paranthracis]|uniref:hypothetical protein n=1 Tax=Bacillus paranthracis TaxID=2026186 RepID=UPI0021FE29FC|nr:hypothetical protein [Bacillus paranthracis]UXR28942.1 hypothetical protein [Bacillus phage Nachito]
MLNTNTKSTIEWLIHARDTGVELVIHYNNEANYRRVRVRSGEVKHGIQAPFDIVEWFNENTGEWKPLKNWNGMVNDPSARVEVIETPKYEVDQYIIVKGHSGAKKVTGINPSIGPFPETLNASGYEMSSGRHHLLQSVPFNQVVRLATESEIVAELKRSHYHDQQRGVDEIKEGDLVLFRAKFSGTPKYIPAVVENVSWSNLELKPINESQYSKRNNIWRDTKEVLLLQKNFGKAMDMKTYLDKLNLKASE